MNAKRYGLVIRGAVQGVGFRPFVWHLARELGLGGFVRNEGGSVIVEVEGANAGAMLARLRREHPPAARIDDVTCRELAPLGEREFRIVESAQGECPDMVPDLATCAECRAEVFNRHSRFCGYAFTNCTRCGPRYSIVERVPYDRANTTMADFAMCAACRAEYEDPANRRFHAQPTACAACGPRLSFLEAAGRVVEGDGVALAAQVLRAGRIVALKGLGGFQLLVNATDARAVARLRERKHRPHKPFAVMVHSLEGARRLAQVSEVEAALLESPQAPIVLLEARRDALPEAIAPKLRELGLMLPTTPLHHLLLAAVDFPVVCTSGNLADEPICTDNDEALSRLGRVADGFVMHDRRIRRALDDSVARVIDGAPQLLRAARGYAPMVMPMRGDDALAMGAHMKNALALRVNGRAVLGQHVGDLENTPAVDAMRQSARDLQLFFAAVPRRVACDLHPDYASTIFAHETGLPVEPVQHHVAHALACMVEHGQTEALAVVWDGTGLGPDGAVWGGEFLHVRGRQWLRVAHLRPFALPGGDAASRDAARALAGLRGAVLAGAPRCTSMGRLFDGVAALLGLCAKQTFEGQAAMWLEASAADVEDAYVLPLVDGELDWRPMLEAIGREADVGVAAAKFHNALAEAVVAVAKHVGTETVALTGGCFQNRRLTTRALRRLREEGFVPMIARRVPPNDGGIALGQLAAL